jgi:glycosyltransferase involved in cell wall biosynthesis
MRLLYITAEVPWPLTSGYLRHFHLLTGLSRGHDITHLSLTRRTAVPADAHDALAPAVDRLEVFGEGRADGLGGGRRALHLRRAARELRSAVARELATGRYDAVLLSGKDTFPALGAVGDTPLVIDVCDAASLRLEGELATASGKRAVLLRARLAEMRHIERRLTTRTPHLLFASERDREAVGARAGVIVPNGIELDRWTRESPLPAGSGIVFSGAMAYRPNDDAARRLVDRVLPLVREQVPDAWVVLAGRDPLPGLVAAANDRPEVTVTGTVDDLRPHLEGAAVYCAPLRFAAGIQNKLLEALAMEIPVVTTPVAAAGLLGGVAEPPLAIADDDAGLAAAVVRLLQDPAERMRLALAGRAHVEHHFSWRTAVAAVEGALERATAATATTDPTPTTILSTGDRA